MAPMRIVAILFLLVEIPDQVGNDGKGAEHGVWGLAPSNPTTGSLRMQTAYLHKTKRHRLSSAAFFEFCGGSRIRTGDPLLAKQVLYQLSYTPDCWFNR